METYSTIIYVSSVRDFMSETSVGCDLLCTSIDVVALRVCVCVCGYLQIYICALCIPLHVHRTVCVCVLYDYANSFHSVRPPGL